MFALVLRVVALTAVYLLALTSLHPGDILTGFALATLLVAVAYWIRPTSLPRGVPLLRWLAGGPALIGGTLVDLVKGSWQTAVCLTRWGMPHGGLVEVPIPVTGPPSAAAWGVRVGFVPDTVVVEINEKEGRMLLHVLDARDPAAVVAEQLDSYERRQRRVFP